jgi:hypothetical protein
MTVAQGEREERRDNYGKCYKLTACMPRRSGFLTATIVIPTKEGTAGHRPVTVDPPADGTIAQSLSRSYASPGGYHEALFFSGGLLNT